MNHLCSGFPFYLDSFDSTRLTRLTASHAPIQVMQDRPTADQDRRELSELLKKRTGTEAKGSRLGLRTPNPCHLPRRLHQHYLLRCSLLGSIFVGVRSVIASFPF